MKCTQIRNPMISVKIINDRCAENIQRISLAKEIAVVL